MTATSPRGEPFWWPAGTAHGQQPVLFFPPSGAEPTSARSLVPHAAGMRFGVAQLAGRGSRHREPPPTDLRALAAEFADAIRRLDGPPAVVVGHSFGGLLAYAVTARLEELGVAVTRLVVVTSADPLTWSAELRRDREEHPDDDLAAFVRRRSTRVLAHGGVARVLLDHPEYAARARELVEVDVSLSCTGFDAAMLDTPIVSIVARDDTVLAARAGRSWQSMTRGGFRQIDVPGDHFFYRHDPRRLMTPLRMESLLVD